MIGDYSTAHASSVQHMIVLYMLGDYNASHDSRVQYRQYITCHEITAQHIIVEYNTDSTVHDRRLQYST